MVFQKGLILVPGHENPEMKSKGTEVHKKISKDISLFQKNTDKAIPKKMQASRYGSKNGIMLPKVRKCGKSNK